MTARIFALFIALLTLMNLFGGLLWPGFDANAWWIHFGLLHDWLARVFLGIAATGLLVFALRTSRRPRRSPVIGGLAIVLAVVALVNAAGFYRLLLRGEIGSNFPLPLSLFIGGGMIVVARAALKEPARRERPATRLVVFGARTYADGRMSSALEDRIRTACELYHEGLARRLVLSGGKGDGVVTEAEAMRNYALKHGVRASDIFVDNLGVNTEATVRDTVPLFAQWHATRVLAVSHFYHLPRVKLAYQRAGVDVCTVPAQQQRILARAPFYMAREVVAFWAYYLEQRPVAVATIRRV
jgi:uncharacterized SAM-binding protein YcdF (DUF218 family)